MNVKNAIVVSLLALAACGKDKAAGDEASAQMTPEKYRQQQQKFADSVMQAVKSPKDIADKLGKGFESAPARLRDTLSALARGTNCFPSGRKVDPYLAGTVTVTLNMSVVGTDVMYVQESSWTSAAGNIVDACLNEAARGWKLNSGFGAPSRYVTQFQFKQVPPGTGGLSDGASAAAPAAPASASPRTSTRASTKR
ncbi:MAG: hypothetical protein NTZ43_06645 [Gemmatimonadetes bacterium]|nr:hypothetical protein [Gemmatimonadota bacterium]